MKRQLMVGLVVIAALGSTMNASADEEGFKVAKRNGCFGCHGIDTQVIGPPWKEVSAKYAGNANAKEILLTSLRKGSRGKWGSVPMPVQGRVSDEDAAVVINYVLSLSK